MDQDPFHLSVRVTHVEPRPDSAGGWLHGIGNRLDGIGVESGWLLAQ